VLWLLSLGYFSKGVCKGDRGFNRRAHVHRSGLFTAETPLGTYQGMTDRSFVAHTRRLPNRGWFRVDQANPNGWEMIAPIHNMLALINPAALPALRIAATFFFIIYLLFGAYIFRNRHRFFDRDPERRQRYSGRSQSEDRSRRDPVARCDHAYPDSFLSVFWLA